ncbi:DUF1002 domain-containing protein [Eremococcus coleocola]|uniref:DUF1002 domain-containing protein n=1 Tax=Eremococcus coleocola TaxID=88132 RepID=UPI0004201ACA|nr:DUF1002 domain-containing protein [Eremococcus coleocola]
MKKLIKVVSSLLVMASMSPLVFADKVAIDPMFTYGGSLNQEQLVETRKALGVQAGTKEIPVQVSELNGLLNDTYPYKQVYSSTYITPASNNGQVTVEIVTPNTITDITPNQYQNAAITAGAVDVNIKVASAVKVDGSGALAGVYKAFQASGQTLDSQAVAVAQDELNVTSSINQEHQNQSGYSDELLNAAIAEIKQNVQTEKDANGGTITQEAVQNIVNNVINNYNLGDILSNNNIQDIQNYMTNFSNLELSQAQKDQLAQFGQTLQEQGGQLLDKAKTAWNGLDEETKSGFMQMLQNIWNAIVEFVSSLFGN